MAHPRRIADRGFAISVEFVVGSGERSITSMSVEKPQTFPDCLRSTVHTQDSGVII